MVGSWRTRNHKRPTLNLIHYLCSIWTVGFPLARVWTVHPVYEDRPLILTDACDNGTPTHVRFVKWRWSYLWGSIYIYILLLIQNFSTIKVTLKIFLKLSNILKMFQNIIWSNMSKIQPSKPTNLIIKLGLEVKRSKLLKLKNSFKQNNSIILSLL